MTPTAIRETLAAAMRHSAEPMVLSDPNLPDTPIVAANQAFADLSGYPTDAVIGRNCRFLQGPATDPASAPRIRASLAAGQGCIEWIRNYRRNGTQFYNLLFISPVHGPAGELLFFFGNQLDITAGSPDWLDQVQFGPAHLDPALEAEFHTLLHDLDATRHTGHLERITAAARRLAEISTTLQPGTLDSIQTLPRQHPTAQPSR